MGYLGAQGLIREKNLNSKILCQSPFYQQKLLFCPYLGKFLKNFPHIWGKFSPYLRKKSGKIGIFPHI